MQSDGELPHVLSKAFCNCAFISFQMKLWLGTTTPSVEVSFPKT